MQCVLAKYEWLLWQVENKIILTNNRNVWFCPKEKTSKEKRFEFFVSPLRGPVYVWQRDQFTPGVCELFSCRWHVQSSYPTQEHRATGRSFLGERTLRPPHPTHTHTLLLLRRSFWLRDVKDVILKSVGRTILKDWFRAELSVIDAKVLSALTWSGSYIKR